MPERVETTDPEGVDFAWVMQATFVLTIVLGAPVVALASIPATLPTWGARVSFAIRVGAIVWIVVAVGAFLHARRHAEDGKRRRTESDSGRGRTDDERKRTPSAYRNDRDREDSGDRGDSDAGEGEGKDRPATPADAHSSSPERTSDT